MNVSEFMQEEIMKAKTSVITLINELSKFNSGMAFPVKSEKKVRVDLDLWNDLFISSDKSIYHVYQDVKDSSWKLREEPLFSGRNYSCMTSFVVDGVKYAAAGYGKSRYRSADFGIDITNLADDENGRERKYVNVNLNSNRGFDGVGVLRGDDVYDVSIVGSHPDIGVVKVPLEELVEKDSLTIDSTDLRKYTLYENQNKQQHAPLKVHKNKLYLGQDRKVKVLTLNGEVDSEVEIPAPGNIKVIEVDNDGNVFSGIDNGMIYRNREEFYAGKEFRSITKMCRGKFEGREGVFFMGELEHGGIGSVMFKDKEQKKAYSDKGLVDFWYNNSTHKKNIVLLTKSGLIIDNQIVNLLEDSNKSNLKFRQIYVGGN
jgi:hypothetical protein